MSNRIMLVQVVLAFGILLFASTLLLLQATEGVAAALASGPVSFALGSLIAALWFARIQSREPGSVLSLALHRSTVSENLRVGSIGIRLLAAAVERGEASGRAIIDQIETITVRHRDEEFKSHSDETKARYQGRDIQLHKKDGKGASSLSFSFATDGRDTIIRYGAPNDPFAIIDGSYRILILRQAIPEATRQAVLSKARSGSVRLSSVFEIEGLDEDPMIIAGETKDDEIHLVLSPNMTQWAQVRWHLDPAFVDARDLPLHIRLWKILRALWGQS